MKRVFKIFLVLAILIQAILFLPAFATAATTTYTDQAAWFTAVNNLYCLENFDDDELLPCLDVTSDRGEISPGGYWWDQLDPYAPTITTWSFANPITAFGGNWNLYVPGGPGCSIDVYINGSWVQVGNIPNSLDGDFWGFISTVPFTQVRLQGALGDGIETYYLDNLVFSLVAALGDLTPAIAFNPINTDHTLSVTVTPAYAGIPVAFVITGAPYIQTPVRYTNAEGVATLTYNNPFAGRQDIFAFIDVNCNGTYDMGEPRSTDAVKYWLENYITGGGTYKIGKAPGWSFSGNVGVDAVDGIVGNFQITDHMTKTTYKAVEFTFLDFFGTEATTPDATHQISYFTATFRNNRDDTTIELTVYLWDNVNPGEGAKSRDAIAIQVGEPWGPGAMWIGDHDGGTIYLERISSGNFQVHDIVQP